ncbi:MAG: hypothetical protein QM704_27120 [Anaeromyxobacteraceae bacterium]
MNRTILALKDDGSLWSWGDDTEGRLGRDCVADGTEVACRASPGRVGASKEWARIASGRGVLVALRNDETAWTWGRNDQGQMGYGFTSATAFDRPGQLSRTRWRDFAVGDDFVVGIDRNYRLRAWGVNNWGQLGVGDQASRPAPTLVAQ